MRFKRGNVTEEILPFFASSDRTNHVKGIIMMSYDELDAKTFLRRRGYKLQWRRKMWERYGNLINRPTAYGVSLNDNGLSARWEGDPDVVADPFTFNINPSQITVTEGIEAGDLLATFTSEAPPLGLNYRFIDGELTNGELRVDNDGIYLLSAGVDIIEGEFGKGSLKDFAIEAYDGSTPLGQIANVLLTTIQVDDAPVTLSLSNETVNANTVTLGDLVGQFLLLDNDSYNETFDFTEGTNIEGYFSIEGQVTDESTGEVQGNVVLTELGVDFVTGGNDLPDVSLTTSHGYLLTNSVTTTPLSEAIVEYTWTTNGSSYATLPDMVIGAGGYIEMDITYPTEYPNFSTYVIDGFDSNKRPWTIASAQSSGNKMSFNNNLVKVSLDGVNQVRLATEIPLDGKVHRIRIDAIGEVNVGHIGARYDITGLSTFTISNLYMSGITNVDEYPGGVANWPMNTFAPDDNFTYFDTENNKALTLHNAESTDFDGTVILESDYLGADLSFDGVDDYASIDLSLKTGDILTVTSDFLLGGEGLIIDSLTTPRAYFGTYSQSGSRFAYNTALFKPKVNGVAISNNESTVNGSFSVENLYNALVEIEVIADCVVEFVGTRYSIESFRKGFMKDLKVNGGLVYNYKMNEGSGTVMVNSGNGGHDGTYHGLTETSWIQREFISTRQLRFDGVDDYGLVDIDLVAGDTVSIDFQAPYKTPTGPNFSLGYGRDSSDGRFGIISGGQMFFIEYASALLDGEPVVNRETVGPIDGLMHTLVLTASEGTKSLKFISRATTSSNYAYGVIKNLKINSGFEYDYRMDEGSGNIMVNSGSGADGTYYGINSDSWEYAPYGYLPYFDKVDTYMTFEEPKVLSGDFEVIVTTGDINLAGGSWMTIFSGPGIRATIRSDSGALNLYVDGVNKSGTSPIYLKHDVVTLSRVDGVVYFTTASGQQISTPYEGDLSLTHLGRNNSGNGGIDIFDGTLNDLYVNGTYWPLNNPYKDYPNLESNEGEVLVAHNFSASKVREI